MPIPCLRLDGATILMAADLQHMPLHFRRDRACRRCRRTDASVAAWSHSALDISSWLIVMLLCIFHAASAYAAADVAPWGNLRGMRVDGTLMGFDTELAVVDRNWSSIAHTEKGKQQPTFFRDGEHRIVTTQVGNVVFRQVVADLDRVTSRLDLSAESKSDTTIEGAYFVIRLQSAEFDESSLRLHDRAGQPVEVRADLREHTASRVALAGSRFRLDMEFAHPTGVVVRRQGATMQVFVRLLERDAPAGRRAATSLTMTVSGQPDEADIAFTMDAGLEGRTFRGLGGNFRLQSASNDGVVISYLLENLHIVSARAELPLTYWQPEEDSDPLTAARRHGLHPRVEAAMELASSLGARGSPLVLSIWSAPSWAIIDEPRRGPKVNGVYGNTWNREKAPQLYKSIASYLLYLKQNFDTEVDAISLNEPDIGVNVHQPAVEHAAMIHELGAYLAGSGLKTKLLLGDTSDATAWRYIEPALKDPRALSFVGALSFHSWRGLDESNLLRWRAASIATNLPLIVAEAGIDSDAWRYPQVFLESGYALDEIAAYLKLIAVAQPDTLMQWQLTSDYPLVRETRQPRTGARQFEPTQRFWNLKQLSETSSGLRALALNGLARDVTAAALGNARQGRYAIHFANNGAARTLRLAGLPPTVRILQVYVTDAARGMSKAARVLVENGRTDILLERESYTTLLSVD